MSEISFQAETITVYASEQPIGAIEQFDSEYALSIDGVYIDSAELREIADKLDEMNA